MNGFNSPADHEQRQTKITQNGDAFLEAVFSGMYGATERPAIGRQRPDGLCPVDPWPDTPVRPTATHFAVGLFEYNTLRTAKAGFKRRFEHCTGTAMLLLDDVGSKADRPDLKPTLIIETSPGNEQWLYLFSRPHRDLSAQAQWMEALINARLTDPGGTTGKLASTRLGRLPGSDPKNRGFPARVVWADMRRRFIPDGRLFGPDGFDLPLPAKSIIGDAGPVTRIDGASDPLVRWLSATGRVLGPETAGGWLPVFCPWADDHTDGDTTGSHLHVADPLGFNCFHGHCQRDDRKPIDALMRWAEMGATFNTGPPSGEAWQQYLLRRQGGPIAQDALTSGPAAAAWAMAGAAMQAADIKEILADGGGVAPGVAAAAAYHARARFRQAERAHLNDNCFPHDRAIALNNIKCPWAETEDHHA